MALAEYLRISDKRRLQTAVRRYKHPKTGRLATLVSVTVRGAPAYYMGLRELIDGRETDGAVVHCEGSDRVPDDRAVSGDEVALLSAWDDCRDVEAARLLMIGWVSRNAWLEPRPSWEVHDLSDLGVLRLVGAPKIAAMVARKQRLFGRPMGPIALKMLRLGVTREMRSIAGHADKGIEYSVADTAVIESRNAVARDAFNATRRDTVLVWDIKHAPGLDAFIRAAGLEHTGTDWHTVTEIPGWWSLLRKPPAATVQQSAYPRPGR